MFQTKRTLPGVAVLLLATAASPQRSYDTDILRDTFGYDASSRASVDVAELRQGCPARDCIPSIDEPRFVPAGEATHVADDDLVLALSYRGEYRAYPARILDQHEIVNDVVAETPIAITYCPLCGSAVGVLRTVDGTVTEFGVSGLLYNSDLVFYDRATNTLWEQIGAEGIVGPLTGHRLTLVPVSIVPWSQWRNAHPATTVLSTDTGFPRRDYTRDYYADYRSSDGLMFPVSARDDTIRPKTRVYGFEVDGQAVAFTRQLALQHGEFRYRLGDRELLLTLRNDGSVRLEDRAAGAVWEPVELYWFAWYTFHPETALVR